MSVAYSPTKSDAETRRPFVTIEECAQAWNRPVSFVQSWVKRKKIPYFRLSPRTIRIRWSDVIEYCCGVPTPDFTHPDDIIREREARKLAMATDEAERAERQRAFCANAWRGQVVYFVEATRSDLVKIGKADRLRSRYLGLVTMSPEPLRLLAIKPGGFADERELHKRFASDRAHGEWFRISRRVRAEINKHRSTYALPDWAK